MSVDICPDPIDYSKLGPESIPPRPRSPSREALLSSTPGLAAAPPPTEPAAVPTEIFNPEPVRRRLRRKAPCLDASTNADDSSKTNSNSNSNDGKICSPSADAHCAGRSPPEPSQKQQRRCSRGGSSSSSTAAEAGAAAEATTTAATAAAAEEVEAAAPAAPAEQEYKEQVQEEVVPEETPVRRRSLQPLEVTPPPITKEEADFREHLSQKKRQMMQKLFTSGAGGRGRTPRQDNWESFRRLQQAEEVPPLPLQPSTGPAEQDLDPSRSRSRSRGQVLGFSNRQGQAQGPGLDFGGAGDLGNSPNSNSGLFSQSQGGQGPRFQTPNRLESRSGEALGASPAPSNSSSWPSSALRNGGTPSLLKRPRSRPPSQDPPSCLVSATPSRSVLRGLPHPELLQMALQLEQRYL